MNAAFERIAAGSLIGRYELLARAGSGGMATVWAARLMDGGQR